MVFILAVLSAKGQREETNSIKGVIIDSSSNSPIPYATVRLKAKDSIASKVYLAKIDGSFVIQKLKIGAYTISISAVGYRDKTITVTILENNTALDLKIIVLERITNSLKNVTVVNSKPVVNRKIDRIAYDVQGDPDNKFQSIFELLHKVPLVSISGNNEITIRGLSGFRVLINGKESALFSSNVAEVLKSMPASNIQSIEIITTPPSNFDSEGFGGIINIVTIKKTNEVYSGRIGVKAAFPDGLAANASGTAIIKKFGISTFASTSQFNSPTTNAQISQYTTLNSPILLEKGNSKANNNLSFAQIISSYEFDTLNLLTLTFGYNNNNGKNYRTNFSQSFVNSTNFIQNYNYSGDNINSSTTTSVGVNIEHHFKKNLNRILTTSYNLSKNKESQNDTNITTGILNYPSYINYQQENKIRNTENTIQLDLTIPIRKVEIDGGIKAILRNNQSDFFNISDTALNQQPAFKISNNFKYQQNVFSIYNSYSFKIGIINIKAGFRIERTEVKSNHTDISPGINQDYSNFIPSISLQRKIGPSSSLTFGYSQRIQRPGIWTLNPFVDTTSPRSISTGNPNLKSSLSNNVEVYYNYYKKISIDFGFSYFSSTNGIEFITTLDTINNINKTTYQNIGSKRKFGFNVSLNYPVTKSLTLIANSNISHIWLTSNYDIYQFSNDGTNSNFYISLSKRFKNNFSTVINANYNDGIILLQGQTNSYFSYSASITKSFFNKWNLSASISNPFKKFRDYTKIINTDNSLQFSTYQRYYRQFYVALSYRFGKLKSSIKQNRHSINNDDVQKGK